MSKLILVFLLVFSSCSFAQKSTWKKLGSAEKVWVILHPFSAKKAQRLSRHTLTILDSLKTSKYFTYNTKSGSRADALRHCYWMSLLSAHIGPKRALWLGRAHEKKNQKDFDNGALEEGFLPDSVAIEMDLRNNNVGAKLGKECEKCEKKRLLNLSLNELMGGTLCFIKQNKEGMFLTEDDQIILQESWSGKWKNERILVPTNWITSQFQN